MSSPAGEAAASLAELNPEQRAAVEARTGPVLVVAGAGAGKTRTIIERVAALILQDQVPPANIMVVTFTNRAANELKERLAERIGVDAEFVCAGTFHSILLNQVLRSNEIDTEVLDGLGIDPFNLQVLDESAASTLQAQAIDELAAEDAATWRDYGCDRAMFENTLGRERAQGKDADAWQAEALAAGNWEPAKVRVVAKAWRAYTQHCRHSAAIDYDDILLLAAEVLRNDPVFTAEVAERFRHIHVDEYQDTNPVQSQVIDLLAEGHRNIFAVGDEKQSIYAFRGSDIRVILGFRKRYPEARVIEMNRNYRSQPDIIAAANSSAACMRELVTGEGGLRAMVTGPRRLPRVVRFSNEEDEARTIVRAIERDIAAGTPPDEIAVLYRNRSHGDALEAAAIAHGMAYRKVRDTTFFGLRVVRDAVALMRFLASDVASEATMRVIRATAWGVSEKAAKEARRNGQSPDTYLRSLGKETVKSGAPTKRARVVQAVAALRQHFRDLLEIPGGASDVPARLKDVWEVTMGSRIARGKDGEGALDGARRHVEALFERVGRIMADGGTYGDALTEFSLMAEIAGDEDAKMVNFSTIHAAKGLEWRNVYLIRQDNERPIEDAEMEEERRVFYVGVTRAKERLTLSYPQARLGGPMKPAFDLKPSRFVQEWRPEVVRHVDMRNRIPDAGSRGVRTQERAARSHAAFGR